MDKQLCTGCGYVGVPINAQLDADNPGVHFWDGRCRVCGGMIYWEDEHLAVTVSKESLKKNEAARKRAQAAS